MEGNRLGKRKKIFEVMQRKENLESFSSRRKIKSERGREVLNADPYVNNSVIFHGKYVSIKIKEISNDN